MLTTLLIGFPDISLDDIKKALSFTGGIKTFGDRLLEITVQLGQSMLPNFQATWWLQQYALIYGLVIGCCMFYGMYAGWRIGMRSRSLTKEELHEGLHPLKVLFVGAVLPVAALALTALVDLLRQMALYDTANGWGRGFMAASANNGSIEEALFGRAFEAFVGWMLKVELTIMQYLLYGSVLLVLIGYVFVRVRRGKWLLQVSMAITLGFMLAYPLQIVTLRFAAWLIDKSYWAGFVCIFLATLWPLIASYAIGKGVDFVELSGGASTVEGDVAARIDDDRPQRVIVEEEVDVNNKQYAPPEGLQQETAADGPTKTEQVKVVVDATVKVGRFLVEQYMNYRAAMDSTSPSLDSSTSASPPIRSEAVVTREIPLSKGGE